MGILAIMSPGMALLAMIGVAILIVVILLVTGILEVQIESDRDFDFDEAENRKIRLERIKKLDNSTWKNRILKWLARKYEQLEANTDEDSAQEDETPKDQG